MDNLEESSIDDELWWFDKRNEGRIVPLAYVMDLCHLKHAEFSKHHPKCKKRVVIHGDNVKDNLGCKGASFSRDISKSPGL